MALSRLCGAFAWESDGAAVSAAPQRAVTGSALNGSHVQKAVKFWANHQWNQCHVHPGNDVEKTTSNASSHKAPAAIAAPLGLNRLSFMTPSGRVCRGVSATATV
ncbi:unnamed protein product [Arctogadus glacialis]